HRVDSSRRPRRRPLGIGELLENEKDAALAVMGAEVVRHERTLDALVQSPLLAKPLFSLCTVRVFEEHGSPVGQLNTPVGIHPPVAAALDTRPPNRSGAEEGLYFSGRKVPRQTEFDCRPGRTRRAGASRRAARRPLRL